MTPERARELASREITPEYVPAVARAILAACAEERRQALTWAAYGPCKDLMFARDAANEILRERDHPKPVWDYGEVSSLPAAQSGPSC